MNEVGQGLHIENGEDGLGDVGSNFVTGNEFDDNGDEGILIVDSAFNFIGARPPIDVREVDVLEGLPEFDLACDIMIEEGGIIIGNSMDRNGDNGIVVRSGSDFTCVIDNTADGNDDDGIDVRSVNNDVQDNQANNNGDDGFDINDAPNTLKDNIANFNEDGIELDDATGFFSEDDGDPDTTEECLFGVLVEGNTANLNDDDGFDVKDSDCAVLIDNTAKNNGENGYQLDSNSNHLTLLGNLAQKNGFEFDGFGFDFEGGDHNYVGMIPSETVQGDECDIETALVVNGNTANGNANDGFSFDDSDNNCIANNVAINNANVGFDLNDASNQNTLDCNLAESNSSDGIESEDSSFNTIIRNTLFKNAGWGVDVDSGGFISVFFNNFLFNEDEPQLTIRGGAAPVADIGNTFDDLEADLCIAPIEELPEPEPEQIPIPPTTVTGKDVLVQENDPFPSFTLDRDYGPEDFFCLRATGTVDLASGRFTANAAGVIVSPDPTNTGRSPGETSPGTSGFPFASLLIGIGESGFVPYFTPANSGLNENGIPGPTTLEEEKTLGELFETGAVEGTLIQFKVNDSNEGDNSGAFEVSNCLVPEVKKSNGGDNQWDTRPTSGLNYENYEQFVTDGIGVNNNFWTIDNDFYQPTDKKELKIGERTTLTIKVYAAKLLWKQVFGLSVAEIGSNNAEVELETTLNRDGSIEGIEVIQQTEAVDPESVSVSTRMVNCSIADTENLCNEIEVQFTLQENLEHLTGYSQSIDFERRADQIWYNEGFEITGEPINPMQTKMIPSSVRYEGLLKVTQVAKYSPYWVADDDRMFEMNSFGSFKQINQSFERFQDTGDARTRMHSGYGGIIAYEQNRALDIFDASNLASELPASFAYIFPETGERITDEMRQTMLLQEQIAKEILDEMDRQQRNH
jgi:parallel beta-helix repeat protein